LPDDGHRRIDHLMLGDAFLFAQPAAILCRLVPRHTDDWPLWVWAESLNVEVLHLRIRLAETLPLGYGHQLRRHRVSPVDAPPVQLLVGVSAILVIGRPHQEGLPRFDNGERLALSVDVPTGAFSGGAFATALACWTRNGK